MRELSHRIESGMQVYPGDPEVRLEPALELARDGVDVALLHLGSHTGTHVDAPSHTVAGGRTTGRIALDELVGEALVVHLAALAPRQVVALADLDAALAGGLPEQLPPIVVVDTGWASRFGTDAATEHPSLDAAAATELVRRGLRVLAVDTLSPDPTGGDGFPVHEAVLGVDRLIVENLCGLEGLPERVRIGFFPLPIDADGAPVRAVAFI
ncbi:cyclase family protein [Agromyces aerolatus]|uniref:cyclase family protein n=1 Tax=Agromyces sp. LY-1074 TaxID=3074080 RepID=UPI0028595344|nr:MULTISPECIES: cyclase family protein [unclassified Agromyces]MDR5699649.1 cyclase family protein [Agromyces sp. LY-1074]MDR5705945.1 cyclase family protein [Agromyces sp. LY-1358]